MARVTEGVVLRRLSWAEHYHREINHAAPITDMDRLILHADRRDPSDANLRATASRYQLPVSYIKRRLELWTMIYELFELEGVYHAHPTDRDTRYPVRRWVSGKR